MTVKRTFSATVQKKCCKSVKGVITIVYDPVDRDFLITDIKDKKEDFEYSLVRWKDKVEEQIEKLAENECRRKGTPFLCYFKVYNARVTEEMEEIIVVPPVIPCAEADIVLYKEIQNRLSSYRKQITKLEAKRDTLKKITLRTGEQVRELRNIINELESNFRLESGDLKQLETIKHRCPDIENQAK